MAKNLYLYISVSQANHSQFPTKLKWSKSFRVPNGFRGPGLRPKICGAPGLQGSRTKISVLQGSTTFHLGLQASLWSNIQGSRYRNPRGSGLYMQQKFRGSRDPPPPPLWDLIFTRAEDQNGPKCHRVPSQVPGYTTEREQLNTDSSVLFSRSFALLFSYSCCLSAWNRLADQNGSKTITYSSCALVAYIWEYPTLSPPGNRSREIK